MARRLAEKHHFPLAPFARDDLPPIAARVHEGMMKAGVVDKPVTVADVQALLDAAY